VNDFLLTRSCPSTGLGILVFHFGDEGLWTSTLSLDRGVGRGGSGSCRRGVSDSKRRVGSFRFEWISACLSADPRSR
jgi:hypothetical protein